MSTTPKISFYVLDGVSGLKALHFACQLMEKAYQDQQAIYAHTNSVSDAERLDALLWTFKEDSFIPHSIFNPLEPTSAPLQIGYGTTPPSNVNTLINLSRVTPSFYAQFEHVIEIVFSDPIVQQLARDRFKQYRDQGCVINTIKLTAQEV